MKITDVRVRKLNTENRLKGIASITIDDCFVVHDIKIIDSVNGLFIGMPNRKTQNGEFRDVAHPINTDTRVMIQKMVLDAYEEAEEPKEEEKAEEKEEEQKED